jgi:hypothetical protein
VSGVLLSGWSGMVVLLLNSIFGSNKYRISGHKGRSQVAYRFLLVEWSWPTESRSSCAWTVLSSISNDYYLNYRRGCSACCVAPDSGAVASSRL